MKTLASVFRCDVRALAAFRVGLAALLLVDVIDRARDLGAHYTDWGLLPCSALLELHAHPAWFSLYYVNGTVVFAAILFIVTAGCALALLFGWRTRLMIVACWVLLISLHNRNPLVLQGGDTLFRLLFFWAMFLPWEATERPSRKTVASAATAALLIQLVMMYVFTGLLKAGPEWHRDLTAVSDAMKIDQLTTPYGRWLLQFPELLKSATWATWRLEVFGSLLFLIPWAPLRLILFAVFFLFQMGLGFALRVSTFPWIATVAMIPFLPSIFWDWLDARRKKWRSFEEEKTVWADRPWQTAVILFFLAYILAWNVGLIPRSKVKLPQAARWIGPLFRIDQYWNMFAPYPLKDDGWFVIPGALADGREVDVFRGGQPVSWEKPERIAYEYKNQRWQKYMMNLWLKEHSKSRLYYGKYLCRSWNAAHGSRETLSRFTIYFMREDTLQDGEKPPEKILLWNHDCFATDLVKPARKPFEFDEPSRNVGPLSGESCRIP